MHYLAGPEEEENLAGAYKGILAKSFSPAFETLAAH